MSAAVDSVKQMIGRGAAEESTPLDPKFTYLRVTRGSHVGLLWLGSVERRAEGAVEVFYSGSGEVVRLLNGRVVGALGLATEWRHVDITPPAWAAVAKNQQSAPYRRTRDVMPGYRSGVRDELVLSVVAPPARTALKGVDAASFTWFEESARSGGGPLRAADPQKLPPARYAVRFTAAGETVEYGEQCLSPDFCFTWQRWSAALQQASQAAR